MSTLKQRCVMCFEERNDEFLTKNAYIRMKLPYPKKVRKEIKIGKVCVECQLKLRDELLDELTVSSNCTM